jgi:hypothetical protein
MLLFQTIRDGHSITYTTLCSNKSGGIKNFARCWGEPWPLLVPLAPPMVHVERPPHLHRESRGVITNRQSNVDGEQRVPWPFSRRYRGPARRFARFCFVRSPRARLGKPGTSWARRMDESPNPGENEEPGAWLGRISPSGCKKRPPGA